MNTLLPEKLQIGWGDDRALISKLLVIGHSNLEVQHKLIFLEVNSVTEKLTKYKNNNEENISDEQAFTLYAKYGLLMESLRNFYQAMESYAKALKFKPNDNDTYNRLLTCMTWESRYDEVISISEKLISIQEDLHYPYSKMIDAYNRQNRMPEAESIAKKLIKVAPKSSFPYLKYGEIFEINGKLDEALVKYEEAVKLEPSSIGYAKCADIYERLRTYQKSIDLHKKALELTPMFEYSRNRLPILEQLLADEERKKVRVSVGG